MALYRQIHVSFWQDPDMLDYTPEDKYFYLYLMTNPKTTQCGIYEISKKVMALETGYNMDTIDSLIQRFTDRKKILYCSETKEVMLLNWLKYNKIASDTVKACIVKELENVKNKEFINIFNTVCIRYGYDMDTPTIDQGEEEEKEEEKEKEKEKEKGGKPQKFTPPTLEEVKAYCQERNNNVDAEKWYNFYSAKGWMIGKNKMKDWKAAVRTWEIHSRDKPKEQLPDDLPPEWRF